LSSFAQTSFQNHPERRSAQQLLAREVSELIHGENGITRALSMTNVLYGSGDQFEAVTADQILSSMKGDSRLKYISESELFNKPLMMLSKDYGLTNSGGAAKALAKSNGFYVNGRRQSDVYVKLTPEDLIDNRVAIMRAGKKHTVVFVVQ
jgi:tyrosyl-tRNA synthetase